MVFLGFCFEDKVSSPVNREGQKMVLTVVAGIICVFVVLCILYFR